MDLQSTEKYTAGSFSAGPQLPAPLRQHCLAYFESNSVIMTGGYGSNKAYVYDFNTQMYTNLPHMDRIRFGHSCYRVESTARGPEIVVAGGFGTNTVQVYNLGTQMWSASSPIPAAASYAASTVPYGESFAVVGGFDGTAQTDKIYLYDKEAKTWSLSSETLAIARRHSTALPIPDALANCTATNQQDFFY